jgi:hypothetical protein
MTEAERKDWLRKQAWLPPEHAAQWTEEVREAWLNRRRAYKAWRRTGTAPTMTKGSVKKEGQRRPVWVPNDEYIAYQLATEMWLEVEPRYINDTRATGEA